MLILAGAVPHLHSVIAEGFSLQVSDWFDSLAECLHWNVRKKQKPLDQPGQEGQMNSTEEEAGLAYIPVLLYASLIYN